MNVNYVHDKAFFTAVPGAVLGQARDLANWYEFYTYGSPDPESILNSKSSTLNTKQSCTLIMHCHCLNSRREDLDR